MTAGELTENTKITVVAYLCRTLPRNLLGYREDDQGWVTAITPEGKSFRFSAAQIEAAHSQMMKGNSNTLQIQY